MFISLHFSMWLFNKKEKEITTHLTSTMVNSGVMNFQITKASPFKTEIN